MSMKFKCMVYNKEIFNIILINRKWKKMNKVIVISGSGFIGEIDGQ